MQREPRRFFCLPFFRNPIRLHVLAILISSALLCRMAGAEVTIAKGGQAQAVIVHNKHTEQAKSLQTYLQKITGAEIPLTQALTPEQKDKPVIVLEVADAIAGTSDRLTGRQAYRIHTDGNRLVLTGRSELGLTHAVYGLLEDHLNVGFYSEDLEVIPKAFDLAVGDIDDTQEPAFAYRGFIPEQDFRGWQLKNRGLGFPEATAAHNFYTWIPPEEYLETHPEWFPLIGGKRTTHWAMSLCCTNEALADELANRLMETMPKADPAVPIAVAQGDGFKGCECEVCRRLVAEEGSEAAPIILMLNRALEKTTKRFPDHKLITFAYFETLKVPRTIRPHKNLWINVTSSSLAQGPAGDQLGPIRGNPRNSDYQEALESWPKLAPERVVVWEWTCNFQNALMEWPNIFNVCDNIRLFHENGVTAVRLQTFSGDGNWGWLRRWLWLKLMWNPKADVEKLTKGFLNAYYGPKAAPHLWEYLQYAAKVAKDSGYATSVCRGGARPENVRKSVFTDDKLARMDALLTDAEKAAAEQGEPVYVQHISRVRPTTVDVLAFLGAGPMAKVKDPRDGSLWLAPGGKPDMPARIDRVAEVMKTVRSGDAGAPWFYRYMFFRESGGRLERIENQSLVVELVPNMHGQIVSILHKPTGQEILASPSGWRQGYGDELAGVSAQEWSVEKRAEKRLDLIGELSPHTWWHHAEHGKNLRLYRSLRLDGEAARLIVERKYVGAELPDYLPTMPNPTRFECRWIFRLPEPGEPAVNIVGGGINQQDRAIVKEKLKFAIAKPEGSVAFTLYRGDGLVVELRVPAAGLESVSLDPSLTERRLTLTLQGRPHAMDKKASELQLPEQVLEVRPARAGE